MLEFPAKKLDDIKTAIDQALKDGAHPYAAFDADGTLWSIDAGETFYKYQYLNRLAPKLPEVEDLWAHYVEMYRTQTRSALIWLAQINEGVQLELLKSWARDCASRIPETAFFAGKKAIIDHLHASNVSVYVVTASVKWVVEPIAAVYGIPEERVLGITTQVIDGHVTHIPPEIVTWREGKVEALLKYTEGKPPFFAAGNTTGDLHLLESATHVRVANASAAQGTDLYESEQELLKIAKERGWFFHQYDGDVITQVELASLTRSY